MPFIGRQPVIGNFVKLDAISVVNGQAAYTMQNGGVNFTSYDNVNQFLVSLNGILQSPTDSFTVSGSTLTFASNLSTGDVIDFVMVLGNTLDIGTPSDNTVSTAKLADSSVTTAKLNDASVSLAKLTATGTKDATTFLRGDNTFAEAGGGDYVKLNTSTFSAVNTVDIDGYFTAAYDHYFLYGRNIVSASGNPDIYFRFLNSGSAFDNSYQYACTVAYRNSGAGGNDAMHNWGSDWIKISYNPISISTATVSNFQIEWFNPNTSVIPIINYSCTSSTGSINEFNRLNGTGRRGTSTDVTGFRIYTSTGSNFSGEIELYGVK